MKTTQDVINFYRSISNEGLARAYQKAGAQILGVTEEEFVDLDLEYTEDAIEVLDGFLRELNEPYKKRKNKYIKSTQTVWKIMREIEKGEKFKLADTIEMIGVDLMPEFLTAPAVATKELRSEIVNETKRLLH
jgi:hypothetical protein